MISISLSPNTEKDDVLLAFKLLFQPWQWKKGKEIELLEKRFKEYSGKKYAFSFNSGRTALMAILDSLSLEKESEVLLQAFTCNAAANPIIWSGLKPVYVDCSEEDFNIDPADLKEKITSRSRAVMVQHTFGFPAEMNKILEICQKNNLILIEDCAHALGAGYGSTSSPQARKKVGTFGQVSFFSFSRDKVISSVYGGIAVTDDQELAEKIKKYQANIRFPSSCWIFQQLLHPILMNWLVLPTYSFFGKELLVLFQWFHFLSKAVHWKEKKGMKPAYFPKKLPNVLAVLALNQFKKLERFNKHRKEIAQFYYQEFENLNFLNKASSFKLPERAEQIYLRFPVKHLDAHKIIKKAWQENMLIGDWYTTPIAPHDTKLSKVDYQIGSCPKAEKLAKQTFNLPTHINISKQKAKQIISFLKKWQ
jgi:perosamine synthetase